MYRYRCDQCRTTSPPVRSWGEVLRERDGHRRAVHGGHIPDSEHLLYAADSARAEWRAAVWVLVLFAVPVVEWLARHVG